jgi:hypothetical protein
MWCKGRLTKHRKDAWKGRAGWKAQRNMDRHTVDKDVKSMLKCKNRRR